MKNTITRSQRLTAITLAAGLAAGGAIAGITPALATEGGTSETAEAAPETETLDAVPALVTQHLDLEVGATATVDVLAGATAGPGGAQWVSAQVGDGPGLTIETPAAITDGSFSVEIAADAPGTWEMPVTAWSWWPEGAADGVEVTSTLTVQVADLEEPASGGGQEDGTGGGEQPEETSPDMPQEPEPSELVDTPTSQAGPYTHVAAMDQVSYDAWLREWRSPYFEELSGDAAVSFPFYSAPATGFCADPTVGVASNGQEAFVRPVNSSASVPPIMEVWATTGQDGSYVDILGSECAQAWGITEFWLPDNIFAGSDEISWEKSADGRGVNVLNRTGVGSSFISSARLPGGEWALLQINTVADYLQMADRTVEVPIGQTASVDLLEGAQWQRGTLPDLGLDGIDVTLNADTTTAQALGLEVTSPIASVTPQQEGSWQIPVSAIAPSGQTGSATLTVVATAAAPSVTVPDRTIKLMVGQATEVDLLEGVTASTELDQLVFGANVIGDVDEFLEATGWQRDGRTVTVKPTTAGTFEIEVWAMSPDYLGYGLGTLRLVVSEPVAAPEPTPGAVEPEATPVAAPVEATPVAEVIDPAEAPQAQPRFETGLPSDPESAPARVSGAAAVLAVTGLAGLGLGLRRRWASR